MTENTSDASSSSATAHTASAASAEAALQLLSERPSVDTFLKNLLSLLLSNHPRYSVSSDEDRSIVSQQLRLVIRALSIELNAFSTDSPPLSHALELNRRHNKKNTKTLGRSFIVQVFPTIRARLRVYAENMNEDDDEDDEAGDPMGTGPLQQVPLSLFTTVMDMVQRELVAESLVWRDDFLEVVRQQAAERTAASLQRHREYAANEAERIVRLQLGGDDGDDGGDDGHELGGRENELDQSHPRRSDDDGDHGGGDEHEQQHVADDDAPRSR